MSKAPIRPPRSIWADPIERLNTEVRLYAQAEGKTVVDGGDVRHAGERRPDLWNTWLDVLAQLKKTAAPNGKDEFRLAANRLEAALRDRVASEALVGMLIRWEHMDDDPFNLSREKYGIPLGKAVAVRLREASRKLDRLPNDELLKLIADLTLSGHEISNCPDAPDGQELGKAGREAYQAMRRLRMLVARAIVAAPKAKGRQPKVEKRARLGLAEDLLKEIGGEPDEVFWALFGTLWEMLTGEKSPPDKQFTHEHIRDFRNH